METKQSLDPGEVLHALLLLLLACAVPNEGEEELELFESAFGMWIVTIMTIMINTIISMMMIDE